MIPEYKLVTSQTEFDNVQEEKLAQKFTPLNLQYLRNVQAQSLSELMEVEKIIEDDIRDKMRNRLIGELNILAHLINTSDNTEV